MSTAELNEKKVLDLGEEFGQFDQHTTIHDWYVGKGRSNQICTSLSTSLDSQRAETLPFAFVLHAYENDPRKNDFHEAMRGFVNHGDKAIRNAESHIWNYYKESKKKRDQQAAHNKINSFDDFEIPVLTSSEQVWSELKFSYDSRGFALVHVRRREHGSRAVYIVLEGSCTWNTDGLCLVLLGGTKVTRVSGYDGHLSNSDAYAMPDLEGAIVATSSHFTSSAFPTTTQQSNQSGTGDFFSWACCGAGF
mmetsp:Transcript_1218/g.1510  ORF Transcript_1218/g.1510 Transcript_1218/m.1510 type:complete len:249 (-) Transcript_1218:281-1027(-)